jgi:NADH:ubiquinone oxidoreductase subunit 2 (subunit N)
LRVVLAIAKPETAEEDAAPRPKVRIGHRVDLWTGAVLAVTAAMTLTLGVAPAVFVDWARHASLML